MNVSEKLIRLRKSKSISQEELAERLGVSRQAVSRWETGSALPDTNNILALSRLYGVTTDYLLNDDHTGGEDLPRVTESKTILHSNLTLIAIIAQASFLNAAAQPWDVGGADAPLAIAVKLTPLLLASIWMAANHRYETDPAQRAKNTKIETCYCICQAAIAIAGYSSRRTLLTTALILAAAFCYIFVVNPKYMNRKLVHRKKR